MEGGDAARGDGRGSRTLTQMCVAQYVFLRFYVRVVPDREHSLAKAGRNTHTAVTAPLLQFRLQFSTFPFPLFFPGGYSFIIRKSRRTKDDFYNRMETK